MALKSTTAGYSPTPLLSEWHSGIPERLGSIANEKKDMLLSSRTLPAKASRSQETPVLPPDVERATFDKAIAELRLIVGETKVEVNDKPLVDGWYMEHPNTHDAFHIVGQEELVCSAVVYPASVAEVQGIMRWANQYLIPVYPISIGRNIGYGGAAPRVPGSVVLDLGKNMNQVLEINEHNASCIVEPGVSYFKLYEEIQKRGLDLWTDTPDLGGGSVMGNALDRGVGYTPMGDHFGSHCGMEIVLPNGELLRTGMGALPGEDGNDNRTWQSFQHAYGPSIDGLFSQSNLGVVVKMGFWLMPPVNHQSYMFTFPRDDDFEKIVEVIRPLALKRVIGNVPQIRHVLQELTILGKSKSDYWTGEGPVPRHIVSKYIKETLPFGEVGWVFYGTQYGPPETIKSQLDMISAAFSVIAGSKIYLPADLPDWHYIHSRAKVCAGEPVLTDLNWLNWVPNAAHLFFSPITPTSGKDAAIIMNLAVSLHQKYGFDHFPVLCVAGREMHYIANIVYNRASQDEKRRAMQLMRELIDQAAKKGYGEYRTHLLFADQVAGTYNWGGNALMKFNQSIKDAIDPNGILAPGRNGIWPKRFRGKGWEIEGNQGLEERGYVVKPKL